MMGRSGRVKIGEDPRKDGPGRICAQRKKSDSLGNADLKLSGDPVRIEEPTANPMTEPRQQSLSLRGGAKGAQHGAGGASGPANWIRQPGS